MEPQTIKLAIISDLHCHPTRRSVDGADEGKNETYLLTDKLRTPSNDHPVDDLLQKIANDEIAAVDITLCPGDFTDKANVQGFISGWGFSLEIHRALKSSEIIATVGNHDVDVYEKTSNYTLEIAKGIKRGFPITDESEQQAFWSNGCVFLERECCRILLINSSHFHHNKGAAKVGKVDDGLLEHVKDYLAKSDSSKIQIAMSHHPPIEHSRAKLGEFDKIQNGESLLNILGKYGFDLFIHGHKHDPLLRYHNTESGHRLPVFASGSFSSYSNLMYTSVRNTFHLITLKKEGVCKGEINTWTFFPNTGWSQPEDETAFPTFTGFGNERNIDDLVNDLQTAINNKNVLEWDEMIKRVPDLPNLIPTEAVLLEEALKKVQLQFDKRIGFKPSKLFNIGKMMSNEG
ncbi:metallophosphoesterase family protein [Niabella beijingensis]|uniref:metallophosphoesterase family protein n=1 Tax=Niabella beijingensis TaxID=2872700 RepID=UPI001CBFD781|nr:metallophosphoesterase [Niabella beijingensis]MBZ4188888.1 metallophosphoesterase [Niabella beijingensis]